MGGKGSRRGAIWLGSSKEEDSEIRGLQGERKDRQERWGKGEDQRAEDGGWERVKQSRRPGPPFDAFHTVLAGGQENPKLEGNQESTGTLCGVSPAFSVALYVHMYVLCYIIYVKDACVATVPPHGSPQGQPQTHALHAAPTPPSPGRPGNSAIRSHCPRLLAPFTPQNGSTDM